MVKQGTPTLPAVGESVRVAWGLTSVHGRVVEVYEGTRPRVVVELDPGTVDDSAATETVALQRLIRTSLLTRSGRMGRGTNAQSQTL